MQPKIKICGITTLGDAALAQRCGADFIGLVCEIAYSARTVDRHTAAELAGRSQVPVILLVDKPAREVVALARVVQPQGLQLIGRHSPEEIASIKRRTGCSIWLPVHIPAQADASDLREIECRLQGMKDADTIVIDTLVRGMKGGTGRTCDWAAAHQLIHMIPVPVFLAGGITPENAALACRSVRPAGIDVSSGVEKSPGVKDPVKIKKLIKEIHDAAAACGAQENSQ